MFGILLLIALNLGLGYLLALALHRPDLLSIAWRLVPTAMPPVQPMVGTVGMPLLDSPIIAPPVTTATNADSLSATLTRRIARGLAGFAVEKSSSPEVQQAVAVLTEQLNAYRSKLGSLDVSVKQHVDTGDSAVSTFVEQFGKLSDDYLEVQRGNLDAFRSNPAAEVQALAEPCAAVIEQHASAITTTREAVVLAAELADSAAACRAFLQATERLRDPSQEPGAFPVSPQEPDSTAALETAIGEFIGKQSGDSKFSLALIDIDQLHEVNQHRGRAVGDRILQAISKAFIGLTPNSTLAIDKERQQLMYFQPDSTARELTNIVEQVRLRIEAAKFQQGSLQLRMTLSSGVAEAVRTEPPAAIVARLQEILREAQRYGRNRTFFQEGEHSAPAIPPVINVESRIIEI